MAADDTDMLLLDCPLIFGNYSFLLPISLNHTTFSHLHVLSPLLLTPDKVNILALFSFWSCYLVSWWMYPPSDQDTPILTIFHMA